MSDSPLAGHGGPTSGPGSTTDPGAAGAGGRPTAAGGDSGPILEVDHLTTSFKLAGRWHAAVKDVSFALARNETLALVGESGCGKSVTALSIMGLLPKPGGAVTAGRILFDGQDLVQLGEDAMRAIRGDRISMIFQEPMTSLNPVLTVGFQVAEALRYHRAFSRAEADRQALDLFEQVKIPAPGQRMKDYPHQFSGGMRQRVMIAMALACRPQVLLADEPTTALDVTIQAQVLAVLAELGQAHGMSMIFITHNLGVVASIADRVAVMYAGEIVELAPVGELFARPTHPYTELLLRSIPRIDRDAGGLETIPGQVPALQDMPEGCRFAPRCHVAEPRCTRTAPILETIAANHQVRCLVRAPGSAGHPAGAPQ